MPSKKNNSILLYSSQWPEYLIELANALSSRAEVSLMLPINHRFTARHRELISDQVKFIPFHRIKHSSRIVGVKLAIRILFEVWRIRPSFFHIQASGGYPFLWVLKYLPKKTKVINTVHDPVLHLGDQASIKSYNQEVIDNAIKYTHRYIVHGETLKKQLSENYKVSPDRISVVPHGHFEIYKKFVSSELDEEDALSVLFFGRIWKYKGLQYFIDAANLVLDKIPNAKFYIVGTGDDLRNYRFDEGKRDNFIIVNKRVTIEEAAHYYSKAAFVVLPYVEATQSGIIPVAYAFGKTVIASRVGAIPEVVVDNVTGFLVEPESSELLAAKIELLLRDNEVRKKMGGNAYAYAMDELSWDKIARKTLDAYAKS